MRRTSGAPGRRARGDARRRDGSVLERVRVRADVGAPPGVQIERQIAVMVREGRLAPGGRLPSTRRLASSAGAHRNTVAAACRRLAARGLVVVRHGARARVAPTPLLVPTTTVRLAGRHPGLLAAAEEPATARLMAAELAAGLDVDVSAEAPDAPALVVALPGAASGAPDAARPPDLARRPDAGARDPIRARQDRRPGLERLLRDAPPLSVAALVTSCPALLEAVRSDVARLRGDGITLRPVAPGDGDAVRTAAPGADLVIADRIALEALLEAGPADGARPVEEIRLLDRRTIAAVRRRRAVPADDSPSRTDEATP